MYIMLDFNFKKDEIDLINDVTKGFYQKKIEEKERILENLINALCEYHKLPSVKVNFDRSEIFKHYTGGGLFCHLNTNKIITLYPKSLLTALHEFGHYLYSVYTNFNVNLDYLNNENSATNFSISRFLVAKPKTLAKAVKCKKIYRFNDIDFELNHKEEFVRESIKKFLVTLLGYTPDLKEYKTFKTFNGR